MSLPQSLEDRMHELFVELVPPEGKAETEAGEIVRAYNRIGYRYLNDGDRLGVGYGNETCNAAGRYLQAHAHGDDQIGLLIDSMWNGATRDDEYEELLDDLGVAVLDLVEGNPKLRDNPTEDMQSYFDKRVDFDDTELDCDEVEW